MFQVHRGVESLRDVLLTPHLRQFPSNLWFGNLQIELRPLQSFGVDELEGGTMDLIGTPGKLLVIDRMQEILPDLLRPEPIGCAMEEACKIPHNARVAVDGGLGEIAELHIADHSLT